MRLYTYCLADKLTPALTPGLLGIGGGNVYLLPLGPVSAVVSEFHGEDLPLTRENVGLHEQVIENILAGASPLPFRFGTLVTEQELKTYCDRHQSSIGAALDRVRGCIEMNVKIITPVWNQNPGPAKPLSLKEGGAGKTPPAGPGTSFLMERAGELKSEEAARKQAETIEASIERKLEGAIRETRVSHRLGQQIFLAVAHLVERRQLARYQELIRELRSEQKDLHFLTSGPWPPYTFTPSPETEPRP